MRVHRESRTLHGYERSYLRAGEGPAVVLVHGIGESCSTWAEVVPRLAKTHTVIAPDLLGHGLSDKPRADYSLGGFANGLRDLLLVLGIDTATVVGHSLGGGIALQFAYQHPTMCERLVLVASGGLGTEVSPLLRLAAMPGGGLGLRASLLPTVRLPTALAVRTAARFGLLCRAEAEGMLEAWEGLRDPGTRRAFLRTLRAVVDAHGQSVTGRDRLYLATEVPTLVVWGGRDHVLPVAHAMAVEDLLPGSRLELLPDAGHMPHRSDPDLFVELLTDFIDTTAPAKHDLATWRRLLAAEAEVTAV